MSEVSQSVLQILALYYSCLDQNEILWYLRPFILTF